MTEFHKDATGGDPRAAAIAELRTAQAAQVRTLTKVRDFAIQVPLRNGGYAASGAELDAFLARHHLPRNGDVQPEAPAYQAEHLTAEGLRHELGAIQARHDGKLAAIRQDALRYQRDGAITQDTLDRFFEETGIEPPRAVWQVSLGGNVRWTADAEPAQAALQEKLQAALNEIAGREVDVSGARLDVRRTVA